MTPSAESSLSPIFKQEVGNPFEVYGVAREQNAAGRKCDGGDGKIVCSAVSVLAAHRRSQRQRHQTVSRAISDRNRVRAAIERKRVRERRLTTGREPAAKVFAKRDDRCSYQIIVRQALDALHHFGMSLEANPQCLYPSRKASFRVLQLRFLALPLTSSSDLREMLAESSSSPANASISLSSA